MARGRQIVRQWKILRALEAARHRGLAAADLVDATEEDCSARTIYRDLVDLQAAGFPLTNQGGRWRVLQIGEGGWSIPVEPTEVLALDLIDDLLTPVRGSYLARPIDDLRARLFAMLTPNGRAFLAEIRQTAVATLFGPGDYSSRKEQLDAIGEAISKQHRLRIRYNAPHREPTERVVEPYSTWYAAGRVYLIAFCHRADDIRIFAVQRVERAEVLDEAFDPDPTFDASAFSRLGFGVYHGAVHHVTIDIDASVAHLIRERRYHHTQQLTEFDDGGVRLEMEAAGLPEIAAWVAGFGGNAVPREPEELIEAVSRIHEEGIAALSEKTE